jgi:hypothetical protein
MRTPCFNKGARSYSFWHMSAKETDDKQRQQQNFQLEDTG